MDEESRFSRRFKAHRWVVLPALAMIALLYLNGALAGLPAGLFAAVVFFSAILAPVQTRRHREQIKVEPVDKSETAFEFLNGLPDPVALLDRAGAVTFTNTAFEKVFGGTALGTSMMLRFRSPQLQELIRATLRGENRAPIEYNWQKIENRWFSCTAWLSGSQDQVLLHFRDLTAAKHTDRIRSDFIANASHELRTPLASLSGFIETLQGPARNDPAARDKFLSIMQDQASRMSRLIDDLLTLSRFETARGRADFVPVQIGSALHHVVDALKPMAESQGTNIIFADSAEMADQIRVLGNQDELIQLFENLVENAVKYGRDNGNVEIRAERLAGQKKVRISVQDDGPGIAPEHLPRLVERFYRVDVDTSRGKQGTGLGLSIVKHIVQRHNGTLKVDSTVGTGTEFRVTLPMLEN